MTWSAPSPHLQGTNSALTSALHAPPVRQPCPPPPSCTTSTPTIWRAPTAGLTLRCSCLGTTFNCAAVLHTVPEVDPSPPAVHGTPDCLQPTHLLLRQSIWLIWGLMGPSAGPVSIRTMCGACTASTNVLAIGMTRHWPT